MSNTVIQIKRSGTQGNVPSSLALGELAINYVDGKIFYSNSTGHILSFSAGGEIANTANAAYDQANTATTIAIAAFNTANIDFAEVNAAFLQANTAYNQANIAYDQANAAYAQANALSGSSNSAYNQANAAYTQANVGISIAIAGYNQSNINYYIANLAYDLANADFALSQTIFALANTNHYIANLAYDEANSIAISANAWTNTVFGYSNTFTVTVGAASNNWTNSVFGYSNTYTNTVGAAGNTYTVTVGAASNTWANTIFGFSNSYTATAYNQANAAYSAANTKLSLSGGTMTGAINVACSGIVFPSGGYFVETNPLDLDITAPYQFTFRTNGGSYQWTFTNGGVLGLSTGGIQFSDGTTQTTAAASENTTNAAFNQANSAYAQANLVYGWANTVYANTQNNANVNNQQNTSISAAFGTANAAANIANAWTNTVFGYSNTYTAAAFAKANLAAQNAFTTIVANGINLYANTNTATVTIKTSGNVSIVADPAEPNLTFDLTTTGVSPATYGNGSIVPVFTVDSSGRITSVTNTIITVTGGGEGGNQFSTVANVGATTVALQNLYFDLQTGGIFGYLNDGDSSQLVELGAGTGSTNTLTTADVTSVGIGANSWANTVVAGANAWTNTQVALAYNKANTANVLGANAAIEFIIDGGGTAITTGQKGHLEIPFNATISQCTLLADQSGSANVEIWKAPYAAFPPVGANTINSTGFLISSAVKNQITAISTTTINAGDVLAYNVATLSTITRLTVSLKVIKT